MRPSLINSAGCCEELSLVSTYIELVELVVDGELVTADGSLPGQEPGPLFNVRVRPDGEVRSQRQEPDNAGRRQPDRTEAKLFRA